MQTTTRYMKDVSISMERALNNMQQAANDKVKPLPETFQEISQYIDTLFTQNERLVRDRTKKIE